MATQEQIYGTDLTTDFDEDIDLKNLIGQDRVCKILQTIIDEHRWEHTFIRPVLLYGQGGSSAVARAYSNSLGNVRFHEIEGSQIGCGVALHELIDEIDEFTTYYITGVDMVGYIWNRELFQFVKDQLIFTPEIYGYRKAQKRYFWGQLIISAEKPTKFTETLEKHCEAVIHLNDCFADSDIGKILNQRIDYYGIELQDREQTVNAIVQVVNGDVKLSINLLQWALKCCHAQGKSKITLQHINHSLRMLGDVGCRK
jgi:Holliday junction resolvasome RuvABC ATP-dependent DNA helicase subunit